MQSSYHNEQRLLACKSKQLLLFIFTQQNSWIIHVLYNWTLGLKVLCGNIMNTRGLYHVFPQWYENSLSSRTIHYIYNNSAFTKKAWHIETMLVQCWATGCDADSALNQHLKSMFRCCCVGKFENKRQVSTALTHNQGYCRPSRNHITNTGMPDEVCQRQTTVNCWLEK